VSRKSAKTAGNPYKILYWMGAALAALALGVVALIVLLPGDKGKTPPDPERTLLWLYDASAQGPDKAEVAIIIEESASRGQLTAIPFKPGADLLAASGGGTGAHKAQELLATQLERQVQHRVFLPYSVVSLLINAAGGVSVDGQTLKGPQAVALIREGGADAPQHAAAVMLALARAVNENGVDMTAGDGLRMARQVETDLDLMAIPDVLGRWSGYTSPQVQRPASGEAAVLRPLLLADPREAQ
jgi:hypothetical protein